MARTGRPRGKKFETYLPQTACTDEMYGEVERTANELFDGNVGALIRKSVEYYLRDLGEYADREAAVTRLKK